MIKTCLQIMTEFANEHSYDTWDELMYDTHDIFQIQYTKEVMRIYASQFLKSGEKLPDEPDEK